MTIEIVYPEDDEQRKRQAVDLFVERVRQQSEVATRGGKEHLLRLAQERNLSPDALTIVLQGLAGLYSQPQEIAQIVRDDLERKLGLVKPQLEADEVIIVEAVKVERQSDHEQ